MVKFPSITLLFLFIFLSNYSINARETPKINFNNTWNQNKSWTETELALPAPAPFPGGRLKRTDFLEELSLPFIESEEEDDGQPSGKSPKPTENQRMPRRVKRAEEKKPKIKGPKKAIMARKLEFLEELRRMCPEEDTGQQSRMCPEAKIELPAPPAPEEEAPGQKMPKKEGGKAKEEKAEKSPGTHRVYNFLGGRT